MILSLPNLCALVLVTHYHWFQSSTCSDVCFHCQVIPPVLPFVTNSGYETLLDLASYEALLDL
jgi:hypothetical protein